MHNDPIPLVSGPATLRELLERHVGWYISAAFLLGSRRLLWQEGILTEVGADYLLLRRPEDGCCVGGDLYALKLLELRPAPAE